MAVVGCCLALQGVLQSKLATAGKHALETFPTALLNEPSRTQFFAFVDVPFVVGIFTIIETFSPVVRCRHQPGLPLKYFTKMCEHHKLIYVLIVKFSR